MPTHRTTGWHLLRAAANTANLSTPVGVAIAVVGRARLRRGPRGLLLAENYRLPFPPAGAFTVGNVVVLVKTDAASMRVDAPDLLRHEEAHSWQYAYCAGLPFLPAYLIASAWSWLRSGHPASANVFERQAGLANGGYRTLEYRSLRQGLTVAAGRLISRGR